MNPKYYENTFIFINCNSAMQYYNYNYNNYNTGTWLRELSWRIIYQLKICTKENNDLLID